MEAEGEEPEASLWIGEKSHSRLYLTSTVDCAFLPLSFSCVYKIVHFSVREDQG